MAASSNESPISDASVGVALAAGHVVQFYETDMFLIEALAAFCKIGFDAGESCLVFVTEPHAQQLRVRLRAHGVDLDAARMRSSFVTLEAGEMVRRLLADDGMPTRARFDAVVGRQIEELARDGRRVRVFGEMAALLWDVGKHVESVLLEEFWNELRAKVPSFTRCCAYPMSGMAGRENATRFAEICGQHTHVLPAETYTDERSSEDRLRAVALLQQRARSLEPEVTHREEARASALALGDANRRMSDFLSIASHELKTPITVIKANLQLCSRRLRRSLESQGDDDAMIRVADVRDIFSAALKTIERADHGANRLVRLADDLLDATRIHADTLELRAEPTELVSLVREVVEVYRQAHPARTITVSASPDTVTAVVDHDRISQVVDNFLSNAIKYAPASGAVQVFVERESRDGVARVSVRDEGPGLPPEVHERIWEQFYRVPGVEVFSGSGLGLGLGLHLCKTIVERHSGLVGVRSVVGEGSTFWFTLPLDAARE